MPPPPEGAEEKAEANHVPNLVGYDVNLVPVVPALVVFVIVCSSDYRSGCCMPSREAGAQFAGQECWPILQWA